MPGRKKKDFASPALLRLGGKILFVISRHPTKPWLKGERGYKWQRCQVEGWVIFLCIRSVAVRRRRERRSLAERVYF